MTVAAQLRASEVATPNIGQSTPADAPRKPSKRAHNAVQYDATDADEPTAKRRRKSPLADASPAPPPAYELQRDRTVVDNAQKIVELAEGSLVERALCCSDMGDLAWWQHELRKADDALAQAGCRWECGRSATDALGVLRMSTPVDSAAHLEEQPSLVSEQPAAPLAQPPSLPLEQGVAETALQWEPTFQIQYRSLSGSHGTLDDVRTSDAADAVLQRIAAKSGVPETVATTLHLVLEGKELNLSEPCHLKKDDTVHVLSRGRGGIASDELILLCAINEAVCASKPPWAQSWTRICSMLQDGRSKAYAMREACPVKPPLEQLRAMLPSLVAKVRDRCQSTTCNVRSGRSLESALRVHRLWSAARSCKARRRHLTCTSSHHLALQCSPGMVVVSLHHPRWLLA